MTSATLVIIGTWEKIGTYLTLSPTGVKGLASLCLQQVLGQEKTQGDSKKETTTKKNKKKYEELDEYAGEFKKEKTDKTVTEMIRDIGNTNEQEIIKNEDEQTTVSFGNDESDKETTTKDINMDVTTSTCEEVETNYSADVSTNTNRDTDPATESTPKGKGDNCNKC